MTPTCEFWDDVLGPAPQRARSHAVTLERVAQGAYRRPGSTGFEPFNKGNPGRPLGARDKRPRQPRGWKIFMALAYAGRVGFDVDTRKVVLIDPDTHEPILDEHGKVINPSYFDVAAEALYLGLQDRETSDKFFKIWQAGVDKMATDRGGRGFRIVMFRPGVDPMARDGEKQVIRGEARQLVSRSESPGSTAAGAQEPARKATSAAATRQPEEVVLGNRDGDVLEMIDRDEMPDPNAEEP
jgi:hypothetical protein